MVTDRARWHVTRLMSVSLTEQAVRDRTKTVTRRIGWTFLKPGDHLTLCRKVMGRKPDEPIVRIAEVEVVSVRRECLHEITATDVSKEGFDRLSRRGFIEFFTEKMRCTPDTEITRIEWRYLDAGD